MKIKFKCTKDEYVRAFWMHYRNRTITKITPIFIIISFLVGVFSLAADDPVNASIAFGSFVLLVSIFLANRFFIPAYIYKRNSTLGDEVIWEFLDDDVHIKSENMDAKVSWSKFTNVLSNPEFFLLYVGKDQFSIIPRRAFESNEQLISFEHLLKEKIKKVR